MSSRPAEPSPLWDEFRKHAVRGTDRVAIEADGQSLTYRQLWATSEEAAAILSQTGVRTGSVVGLLVPNSLAFVPLFLAACRLGAVTALLPAQLGALELRHILEGIPFHSLLTSAEQAEKLGGEPLIRELKNFSTPLLSAGLCQAFPCSVSTAELIHSSPAATSGGLSAMSVYKFTSGSTGKPKGVALTAANVLAEAENIVATLALTAEDRIFAPVPLAHSYGFDLGVLALLASGARLVLHSAFVPRRALAEISSGATIFLGVPSMYRAFLESRLETTPDLRNVRYLLSCTAPLNPETIAAFHEKFRAPICQHYGSSEAGAVSTHMPEEILKRPNSVGRAMKNVELRVVDDRGRPVPAGVEGHIVVRSAAVAQGYVLGAPAGPSPLGNGQVRMGDLGVLDAEGFLEVRGRSDSMINIGGLKVWPEEVARVLEDHPAVREAVVFGVPTANGECCVGAVVAIRDVGAVFRPLPALEADLIVFCQSRLASFKVPRKIEIRSELRRGPTGKAILGFEQPAPGVSAGPDPASGQREQP
jgi:long-chain acyl-CoA synthetase